MKINTARDNGPAPLVLLNELNGLVSLCKSESGHASKVPERGYFNIVTLLQKVRKLKFNFQF